MRDLRLRAGDEEAEEVGGDRLLVGRERAERVEQMVLDDALRAAELVEPRERERMSLRRDGRAPEPVHDELEERRLDVLAVGRARSVSAPARHEREPPDGRGVEDGLDEAGLERVRRLVRRPPVPLLHRALDRAAGGRTIEMLDAHVVREQARDVPLEAVELREARPP